MFNLDDNKRIVILSAERSDASDDSNANATATLASRLALGLASGDFDSVVKCDGQYQGTPERSFMVICDKERASDLLEIAGTYDQECILVLRRSVLIGQTKGALYYPNGTRERIGLLELCDPTKDYVASTTISGTSIAFHFA